MASQPSSSSSSASSTDSTKQLLGNGKSHGSSSAPVWARDVDVAAEHSERTDYDFDEVEVQKLRTGSVWTVAMVAFFLISGGPVGIEGLVKAGGPLYAMVCLFVFPLLWAFPQAIMTAEMSTMMAENGGFVIWTYRAFGPLGGWLNGYISIFNSVFDLALYPTLVADYLDEAVTLSTLERWITIIVVVVVVTALNLGNVDVVGKASVVFMFSILLPFVVQFLQLLVQGDIKMERFGHVEKPVDWTLLVNVIFWNFSGWDSLGSIAGEVKNPKRTYPLAVLIAISLCVINYIIPTISAVSVSDDYQSFDDGYFVKTGQLTGEYLRWWILVASVISSVGIFNASLATSSRALWRCGKYRFLPQFVTYETRHGTPLAALVFFLLTTVALCNFSFNELLEVDNFMFGVTLIMEKGAFVYLKYSEPNADRPFRVPGGVWGALGISLPPFIIICIVLFLSSLRTWLVGGGLIALFLVMYVVWRHGWFGRCSAHMVPTVTHLESVDITYSDHQ